MKLLLLILLAVKLSQQSQCLVSEWGSWSECHGGCQRGLIVRNRDVLQPPLPELTADGKTMQRLCPHLYETRYCSCHGEANYQRVENKRAETDSARNLVERQMKKMGIGRENDSAQAELKKKLISETEQLFQLDEAINRRFGPQPSDQLVNMNTNNNNTSIIDISTQQLSNEQWREDVNHWSSSSTSTTSTTPMTTTVTTTTTPATTTTSSLPAVSPKSRRKSSDHSVSNLLRKIEQALDTNQPLDEKYVKLALRRNRKLSKLLVDAYRQRQALMATETPATTQSTTVMTTESTTTEPSTTTAMLYWPKTGYVPNTRKHASEITAQLYMTNEIVQTLADDPLPMETHPDCEVNKRCCKVIKNTCGDGVDPKFVKRWYRPKGSSVCVPYHYPRCSSIEEMEELPILFEQNCQDICFSKHEKRINPLFHLESDDE